MDLTLTNTAIFPSGRFARNRDGGRRMADLNVAVEAAAGAAGLVLTAMGVALGRKDKQHEMMMTRLATVEDDVDHLRKEVAELRSDKQRLESEKYGLQQIIGGLQAEKAQYERDRVESQALISNLETLLTQKTVELHAVEKQIEQVNRDMANRRHSDTLYQKQEDGTYIPILEGD